MTVYRPKCGKTWRFDFRYRGRRYQGSTDQLTREDAELAEAAVKKRLRQHAWGILPIDRAHSPSFTEWAPTVLAEQRRHVTRADIQERTLRMVLAFFGRKPKKSTPVAGGPYHNLKLIDPILDPEWIVKFDAWMEKRGLAGSTKNSYRSMVSTMYRVAMRPKYRKVTSVLTNPMEHIDRDQTRSRTQTLTSDQLRAWMRESVPHVRLAIAIGALAPKLRLASVLALRWDRHIDADVRFITIESHKTIRTTGQAQVVPVDPQLRAILLPERRTWIARKRTVPYVIHYRGEPVKSIKAALKRAARDANIPYGIDAITFHSLRHSVATWLAELGVPEKQRQAVMGHLEIRTTQRYTHLRPMHEVEPLARLSATLPILELFDLPGVNVKGSVSENLTEHPTRSRRETDTETDVDTGT